MKDNEDICRLSYSVFHMFSEAYNE